MIDNTCLQCYFKDHDIKGCRKVVKKTKEKNKLKVVINASIVHHIKTMPAKKYRFYLSTYIAYRIS